MINDLKKIKLAEILTWLMICSILTRMFFDVIRKSTDEYVISFGKEVPITYYILGLTFEGHVMVSHMAKSRALLITHGGSSANEYADFLRIPSSYF